MSASPPPLFRRSIKDYKVNYNSHIEEPTSLLSLSMVVDALFEHCWLQTLYICFKASSFDRSPYSWQQWSSRSDLADGSHLSTFYFFGLLDVDVLFFFFRLVAFSLRFLELLARYFFSTERCLSIVIPFLRSELSLVDPLAHLEQFGHYLVGVLRSTLACPPSATFGYRLELGFLDSLSSSLY